MQATFEEKKEFLLKYPDAFTYHVSSLFPFSHRQLQKYKDILIWDEIAANEKIQWSTDIIDEFKDRLFSESSIDHPWSISSNEVLPWDSIEFVKRYEDLWEWDRLAECDLLKGECRAYYLERLQQSEYYTPPEPVKEKSDEEILRDEMMEGFDMFRTRTRDELQDEYQDFHDFLIYHPDLAHTEMDWKEFSKREYMYWTQELVETYEEHWDWIALSNNPSLPWTYDFIKRFEDRWIWHGTEREPDEDGIIWIPEKGVGYNLSVAWTAEMLEAFHEKIGEHNNIINSTTTKWTLPLLDCYAQLWQHLFFTMHIWETLFSEFDEEENVVGVLDGIIDMRQVS